jgi:hypothetical protein
MEKELPDITFNQVTSFMRFIFFACICAAFSFTGILFFLIFFKEFVWYEEITDVISRYDYSDPTAKYNNTFDFEFIEIIISLIFGLFIFILSFLLTLKKLKFTMNKFFKVNNIRQLSLTIFLILISPFVLAVINRAYFLKVSYDYMEQFIP